jgi:fluoroacetyl-CoA thioesterase
MEPTIKPGLTGKMEHIVRPQDSASNYRSGTLEVFATPAMIALMEQTAMNSVQHLLPEGYSTVGVEIRTTHLKATAIGKKVICDSNLVIVSGKELEFEISAFDEVNLIGKAYHKRVIIDVNRFLSRI